MQRISGKNITLTRGDSLVLTVSITKPDGTTYEPQEGDVIRFAMKKRYTDSEPLIVKTIPHDTMELYLGPDDTKSLAFGSYVYDMQLTYANGDVDTFIDQATLTLTKEVD